MTQAPGGASGQVPPLSLTLALTGSVGCILLPPAILYLRATRQVSNVRVILSRGAQQFVTPFTARLVSGADVLLDTFDVTSGMTVPHLEVTKNADALIVIPATANVIAKAAHGICDDVVGSAILACDHPVIFVPSMNEAMWNRKAQKRNVELARDAGYFILDPDVGHEVSDMTSMYGGMPHIDRVIQFARDVLGRSSETTGS